VARGGVPSGGDEGKAQEEKKEEPKKDEAKKDGEKKDQAKEEKKDEKKDDAGEKQKEEVLKILKSAKKAEARAATEPAAAEASPAPGAAKEKADAKAAKEKKGPATARKKELDTPMFRLRDGTFLAGIPDLKMFHVTTAYGGLVVPVNEVVRVRFASLKDEKMVQKIQENIQALGSEEFDRREEAMTALREIGPTALDLLKKALESDDEEIKTRAEKLISEMEETLGDESEEESRLGPLGGAEDEIETKKFTVVGHVEEETLMLATRYGSLKLDRKDVVSVKFQESPTVKSTFQVPGSTFAGGNKWFDTKLNVAQGERLHISASGTINVENYGQQTGPEGTSNISGNQLESFPAGALVGKIGDKGKTFLVGADYQQSANGTGKLLLGVSLQNGNVTGNYAVEVETEAQN
jgi:hypothetical protein